MTTPMRPRKNRRFRTHPRYPHKRSEGMTRRRHNGTDHLQGDYYAVAGGWPE